MSMTPSGGPSSGGSSAPRRPGGAHSGPSGLPGHWGRTLHWAALLGGITTVVDLALLAVQQRTVGGTPGEDPLFGSLSLVASAVLYSTAGASVVRDTGRVAFAATAGLLAGMIDGMVVGAASAMLTPVSPGTPEAANAQLLWLNVLALNVLLGLLLALLAATIVNLMARRMGGSGPGRGSGPGSRSGPGEPRNGSGAPPPSG